MCSATSDQHVYYLSALPTKTTKPPWLNEMDFSLVIFNLVNTGEANSYCIVCTSQKELPVLPYAKATLLPSLWVYTIHAVKIILKPHSLSRLQISMFLQISDRNNLSHSFFLSKDLVKHFTIKICTICFNALLITDILPSVAIWGMPMGTLIYSMKTSLECSKNVARNAIVLFIKCCTYSTVQK